MTLENIEQYLNSFVNYEKELSHIKVKNFSLKRVKLFFSYIDNPQNDLKVIHVAGTKAKGSVSIITARILQSAGYKVGLYTSPHFFDIKERIRIFDPINFKQAGKVKFDGKISEQEFKEVVFQLKPKIKLFQKQHKDIELTYFEIMTAVAYCYFKQQKVDFVVCETGLGGRFDATNVCNGFISVLTPIGLEHTAILGKTLSKIAKEKMGIIKRTTSKLILSPQKKTVLKLIEKRCNYFRVPFLVIKKDITYKRFLKNKIHQSLNIWTENNFYQKVNLSLLGEHQCENFAVAIGVIETLLSMGYKITSTHIKNAANVLKITGRIDVFTKKNIFVFDIAHTKESFEKMISAINEMFPKKKVNLMLGISNDKDIRAIFRTLAGLKLKTLILTKSSHARAADLNDKNYLQFVKGIKLEVTDNVADAINVVSRVTEKSDVNLVAGSIFLVSEVQKSLIKSGEI